MRYRRFGRPRRRRGFGAGFSYRMSRGRHKRSYRPRRGGIRL